MLEMAGTNHSRDSVTGGPAIILVEPQLGENIGTAARAMMNCGLDDLRLVRPRDGWPNDKAVAAASGADAVLDKARLYPSVEAAIGDLVHVYASTARDRYMVKRELTPRHAAAEMRGFRRGRRALRRAVRARAHRPRQRPYRAGRHGRDRAAEPGLRVLEPGAGGDDRRLRMVHRDRRGTAGNDALRPQPRRDKSRAVAVFRPFRGGAGRERLSAPPRQAPEHDPQPAQPVPARAMHRAGMRTLHGVITAFMGPRQRRGASLPLEEGEKSASR